MGSFKVNYVINKEYKNLIKKDVYETILLKIMNMSNIVFPGMYKHIDKQSNGESDFEEIQKGELLDAKTIFPKKQCEKLSLDKLEDFYKMICNETNDIFDVIINKKGNLNSTILYKEIVTALKKIEPNENVIVFIPFPFTLELEGSLSALLASDIFSQIIFRIKKDSPKFFKEHQVYFVYPNLENKIILKNLTTGSIEYLKSNLISDYIYVKLD